MSAIDFATLLAHLGAAVLELRRADDPTVAAVVMALPAGRRVLAIERTYREGTRVILDPTSEELEIAHSGNLWDLWNSDRAELLHGIAPLGGSWQSGEGRENAE